MLQRSVLVGAALAAAAAAQGGPETKFPRPPVVQPDVKEAAVAPVKVHEPEVTTPAPASRPERANAVDKAQQDALSRSIARAREQRDVVLFDQPTADGPLWFAGSNYKASFAADGWQFIARPSSATLPSQPVHFRASAFGIAGQSKNVDDVTPVRLGDRVEYRHDSFVEAIDLRGGNVEQTFRFDTLPARGELTMTLAVTTEREGVDRGDGVTFDAFGETVTYSEAIAIDATGAQVVAETVFANGTITIRVPAGFVEQARLPLLIDPVVASGTVTTNSSNVSNPDLVWLEATQNWAAVYEQTFSANDIDVFVQLLDVFMAPIGSPTSIDFTGNVWQLPRIATLHLYGKSLVVAQVSVDAPAPYWISGRVIDGTGTPTTSQFDIARAGVTGHFPGDKLRPDVGGDPYLAGPTYFTVVWEREFSPTDHDIHMKQVTENGTLRSASPTLVDSAGTNESNPTISKSNGPGQSSEQRWVIAYQRTFSPTDEDIRGAMVTWDGQIVQVAGNNTFAVNPSTANDVTPVVSTPTDGGANGVRHVMFAYHRTTSGAGDIFASVMATSGTVLDARSLTALANDPGSQPWPQSRPQIDCDGTRFAVTYQELFGGAGNDLDTFVDLLGFDTTNNTIVSQEARVALGTGLNPELSPSIASRYSGSATRSLGYGIVWEQGTSAPYTIEGMAYAGFVPGPYATRFTQCGIQLGISANGTPAIGMSFDLSLTTAFPLSGFVFGTPISVPIPTCGCTLGVNGQLVVGTSLPIAIPQQVSFVGLGFAVQGFTFAGGPCLGGISVSDTIDFVIR